MSRELETNSNVVIPGPVCRMASLFALALIISLFGQSGTAPAADAMPGDTSEGRRRFDLSPLFFSLSVPAAGSSEREAFGPFVHAYSTPQAKGWAIRPLLTYTRTPDRRRLDFLYPLGAWEGGDRGTHWRLSPLFSGRQGVDAETARGSQQALWPLFWGRTADGSRYGGVFPAYGTFLERFGRDKIVFILWPLYSESRWEGHRRLSLLWPVFSHVSGPEENGWRVWPLWGHTRKEGSWERRFALWPIFFDEREGLDTDRPVHRRMLLPLYVREERRNAVRQMFLWPFFQVYRDTDRGFRQWDLPWPFIGYARGPQYRSWRVWPLVGERRTETSSSRFVLWPLYSSETVTGDEQTVRRKAHNWLLFSTFSRQWGADGEVTEVLARVWPLYLYHRLPDGVRLGHAPAILPFEDKGFQQVYGPFLRLYEFQEEADGSGRSKALWGFYRHDWTHSWHQVSLSLFFSAQWSELGTDFAFLGGLFGMRRQEGTREFTILFRTTEGWGNAIRGLLDLSGNPTGQ